MQINTYVMTAHSMAKSSLGTKDKCLKVHVVKAE